MENNNNNSQKRSSNKVRLQSAISDIMSGYLFLNEAVEKYEVPASTIIQHLKKIQKEKKKDALELDNSKIQAVGTIDSKNKAGN